MSASRTPTLERPSDELSLITDEEPTISREKECSCRPCVDGDDHDGCWNPSYGVGQKYCCGGKPIRSK